MAWTNSVSITINHSKVPNTDQSDFPVLFTGVYNELRGVAFGGQVTHEFGFDIIFALDPAGASPMVFERTSYIRQTGACEFWVKVPTLSHVSDTVIYILLGNSAIVTDQQNSSGTWSNGFGLVMHYGSPSQYSSRDSTGVTTAAANNVGGP